MIYALVSRASEGALPRRGGVEVLARYPSLLLVRAPVLPASVAVEEMLEDTAVSVHGLPVEIPEGLFAFEGAPHVLVRLAGPVAPEWTRALEARGVRVLFWCPRFGACLALPEGMDEGAFRDAFPFVLGARPLTAELCSRGTEGLASGAPLPAELVDVVCFTREDRARVEAELAGRGIEVLDASSVKLRVRFGGDLAELREMVGVRVADPARAPRLLSAAAAPAQAAPMAGALGLAAEDGGWRDGLAGRGQVVAVADTGLDRGAADATLHPDFRGRVVHLRSWPVNPSWTPFVTVPGTDDGPADLASGHGTHVAGLAVGSGALSGGRHRGVAPEAGLVFQALEQRTETRPEHAARFPTGLYLSGRPLDLRLLFRAAAEQGARIHVNAWGDPARGRYTDDCYEADLFLRENPEHLVLFAAGNDGADADGDRVLDGGSLYAPASAKNVVAIGATEGPEAGVGMRTDWGGLDLSRKRWPTLGDRADPISGDPERVALCTSAGPTADGRIKPDLCAPGTNLVAPRSAVARGQGWGLASPMPHYMYNGGTSMAVGVAGGFAALVRQAWQEHAGGHAPSGPALKALLVLGALPVIRRGDSGAEEPRHVAGFGRLHFAGCAPRQEGRTVLLMDGGAADALRSGEVREHRFTVGQAGPLRAVLAWYDAPGETLVNDLDLSLVGPGGRRVWGNHPAGGQGAPDRANTVEVIHLPGAEAGEYVLRVAGANVPAGPQPFALALSHPAAPAAPAAPPAPAPAARAEIPVDYVWGIGRATAARLAAAGVRTAAALARLDEAALAEATGFRGRTLAALRARLELLASAAARPAPALPAGTTLARAAGPLAEPPSGMAPEAWRQITAELSPLALVFDRARLSRVRVADLFRAAP